MKQFHLLLSTEKNCDWSGKITPLSNLTRVSLLRGMKTCSEKTVVETLWQNSWAVTKFRLKEQLNVTKSLHVTDTLWSQAVENKTNFLFYDTVQSIH